MIGVAKDLLEVVKGCARGLRGVARRIFQAQVTCEYLDGNARQAERVFGWNRKTVAKGLVEQEFGVELATPPDARGRPRSEDRDARQSQHVRVQKLVIELDNGPEVQSHRTQFMRRLTEFADSRQLEIELVYFPPYHSKYNPIERCWSALERHWNGSLLNSVSAAIHWARTMTWKMLHPTVALCETIYERGVRLTRAAFAAVEERLERAPDLSRWSVRIQPHPPVDVIPVA